MRHINHQFKLVFWKVHTHNKAHLTSLIGKLLLLFLFMLSEANSLLKINLHFFPPQWLTYNWQPAHSTSTLLALPWTKNCPEWQIFLQDACCFHACCMLEDLLQSLFLFSQLISSLPYIFRIRCGYILPVCVCVHTSFVRLCSWDMVLSV